MLIPDPQGDGAPLQRVLRFLVPGTGARFRCGGLLVELQTARLLGRIAPVQLVTYRCREEEHPFLDDLLRQEPTDRSPGQPLWIVSWGFDVPALLRHLRGRLVLYHAHSSGYGFALPPGVPVLAVSRNTLGYWGDRAPRNPLFLVPNALDPAWLKRGERSVAVARAGASSSGEITAGSSMATTGTAAQADCGRRAIDVLVQQRKSSRYVLQQLVPALRQRGLRVEVQDGWVEDLVGLFNSASIYIYDSADHWRTAGVSEGFGLPPLEALACGCVVFSSCNHALADSLDPGRLGHQIGWGSLRADVERIAAAAADPEAWRADPNTLDRLLESCSEENLLERWRLALRTLEAHWQQAERGEPWLRSPTRTSLRLQRLFARLGRHRRPGRPRQG